MRQRLDVQAARATLAAAEQALALRAGFSRYFPSGIALGVDTEREPEGEHITGPTLDLELPVFNQGQGEIATLRARDLQARRLLEQKIIDARSEVRAARAQVAANRELALSIKDTVLPQRQQVLALTLQRYNGMLAGAYDLLTASPTRRSPSAATSKPGATTGSPAPTWSAPSVVASPVRCPAHRRGRKTLGRVPIRRSARVRRVARLRLDRGGRGVEASARFFAQGFGQNSVPSDLPEII